MRVLALVLALAVPAAAQEVAPTIERAGPDRSLAGSLGAVPVYDASGARVGDVEGVLIGHDGRVAALLIGVGGLLGVLEKPVAVRFEHLTLAPAGEDGALRVDLALSRAELSAAPRFQAE